VTQHVHTK